MPQSETMSGRPFAGATLVFDLDGTLVDSAPDLHRSLNHVLAAEGLPLATLADVRAHVGTGARNLIMRSSAVHGVTHTASALDRLTQTFVAAYSADIAGLSRVFPGVEAALDHFQTAGARVCVCTNKPTGLSNQLLSALGLSARFAAIVGADSVVNRKPHGDHFLAAVEAVGGHRHSAMMVGDSINDVGAARAAGAPVALYAYGYTDTAPELLGADAVFTHYNELPALAVRLLRGRLLAGRQPSPRT